MPLHFQLEPEQVDFYATTTNNPGYVDNEKDDQFNSILMIDKPLQIDRNAHNFTSENVHQTSTLPCILVKHTLQLLVRCYPRNAVKELGQRAALFAQLAHR
jgi:hypothetical protein